MKASTMSTNDPQEKTDQDKQQILEDLAASLGQVTAALTDAERKALLESMTDSKSEEPSEEENDDDIGEP